MKNQLNKIILLLLVFAAAGLFLMSGCTSTTAQSAPAPRQLKHGQLLGDRSKICIVQDTLQDKTGIPQIYKGKEYYLCCMGCVEIFQKNPEKLTQSKDPVSGAVVDKAFAFMYARGEKVFYFESMANLEKFDREGK